MKPIPHLFLLLLLLNNEDGLACDQKFEGFGLFLGSNSHFSKSPPGTEEKVMEIVWDLLGVRLFRTSYEENFSPEPNRYSINCTEADPFTCSWIRVHRFLSNQARTEPFKLFASIWSPPHYMKNEFYQLLEEEETPFYHFIKNVTALIRSEFNLEVERVSPVNEPENWLAPWDHTNMSPEQMCRFIRSHHDPLISLCPENSYFWVSKVYYNFESDDPALNCTAFCDIQASHAYALNLDLGSENSFLAYYDLKEYQDRGTSGPVWMTEVSSTYKDADQNEMEEALDLAQNILNFVGSTCVQRYYFWYAYTLGPSGESLIWGQPDGSLHFPKKFFVYKTFVNASGTREGPVEVNLCNTEGFNQRRGLEGVGNNVSLVENLGCLQFGDDRRVFVNREIDAKTLLDKECRVMCCTDERNDMECKADGPEVNLVPAKSVCQCVMSDPVVLNNSIVL